MGRSDQEKAREQDFMGLGCSDCAEAIREHVYASSHMHGASKHVCMNSHTYNVDPHVSSQHYADAFAVMQSNVLDAIHRPTASRYDDNVTNSLANGSLAFDGCHSDMRLARVAGKDLEAPMTELIIKQASSPSPLFGDQVYLRQSMRRPDWSNPGGRQQFLSFSSSQEQRLEEKVNDAYRMIHARGHGNAVLGSTALNCNLPANFLTDHSGLGMKVFPFVAPVLHEQASTVRAHKSPPTASGRALIPPFLVTGGDSTRMLRSDSSIKPSSPQLTIFYAGKVNVYNDVSSIKAQEIMLMAAAGHHLPSNKGMFGGKSIPMVMPPVPGPLMNADPPELPQVGLPPYQSDQLARDPVGIGPLPARKPQAPQAEESFMPNTQSAYLDNEPAVPRALPQARKASLARFLEKRKERMLSKSPYLVRKTFL